MEYKVHLLIYNSRKQNKQNVNQIGHVPREWFDEHPRETNDPLRAILLTSRSELDTRMWSCCILCPTKQPPCHPRDLDSRKYRVPWPVYHEVPVIYADICRLHGNDRLAMVSSSKRKFGSRTIWYGPRTEPKCPDGIRLPPPCLFWKGPGSGIPGTPQSTKLLCTKAQTA